MILQQIYTSYGNLLVLSDVPDSVSLEKNERNDVPCILHKKIKTYFFGRHFFTSPYSVLTHLHFLCDGCMVTLKKALKFVWFGKRKVAAHIAKTTFV
jgi:hypothetical protein